MQELIKELELEIQNTRELKDEAPLEDKLVYNWIIQWLLYAKILIRNKIIKDEKFNTSSA